MLTLLKDEYGIKRKPITMRNPQVNAMVERAHQTIHNLIVSHQVHDKDNLPTGLSDEESWMGILSAVAFAMRATIHTTTQATPTQLVFNRDAILNVKFQADWEYIKERKQRLIIQNNKRENKKRQPYVYQVGDKALIIQDNSRKHGADKQKGPYTVTRVYDNGTVKLRQDTPAGGAVSETWNIRNIIPYEA